MSGKKMGFGVGLSAWVQSCNRIEPILMTFDMIKGQLHRNGIEEGFNLEDHVAFRDSGFTRRVVKTGLMLMNVLEQGIFVDVNSQRASVVQYLVVGAEIHTDNSIVSSIHVSNSTDHPRCTIKFPKTF